MLQTLLLGAAMFALGCGVRPRLLATVWGRPAVLGAASTTLILGLALLGATLIG